MIQNKHTRCVQLAGCLALLALEHCARPSLQLRSPPSLSVQMPSRPQVPDAVSQESAQGPTPSPRRVTSTRPVNNPREQTILLVLDGDASLRAAMLDVLPTALITARFTRVLLPPTLEGVSGSVERGAAGERTTLTGPAHRLLPMRANTPVDAVLHIELQRAGEVIERTTRYEVPADALQRYAEEVNRYNAALQQAQRQLAVVADYPAEAEAALQTYQRQGGRFDDEESRLRMEEARSFVIAHTQLNAQLRAALSSPLPGAEAVQRGAATRASTQRERTPGVRLRAIFSDLRAGETYWVDDVRVPGADENAALSRALTTLIEDLGGS
jgi:hypothetical protein